MFAYMVRWRHGFCVHEHYVAQTQLPLLVVTCFIGFAHGAAAATIGSSLPDMAGKQPLQEIQIAGLLAAGCLICCCQVSCSLCWLKHQQQHVEHVVIRWSCCKHLVCQLQDSTACDKILSTIAGYTSAFVHQSRSTKLCSKFQDGMVMRTCNSCMLPCC